LHRAETPRRRENQDQDFGALSCEKPFQANCDKDLLVLSGEAGKIGGFPCASASLRENVAFMAQPNIFEKGELGTL
jgi:hypothetical protein